MSKSAIAVKARFRPTLPRSRLLLNRRAASVPMFRPIPALLRLDVPFWLALPAVCVLTVVLREEDDSRGGAEARRLSELRDSA
jgi:hypothetical protein